MAEAVSIGSSSPFRKSGKGLAFSAIMGLAFCHLLNDAIQSLLPALYPLMKETLHLSFSEIGIIGLVFQATASLIQPAVGLSFDRFPRVWPLPLAICTLAAGLVSLSLSQSYPAILFSAFAIGVASAIFHPEASRGARLLSGGRIGFAQSFFQFGGSLGSACGPLLVAFLIVPYGQRAILLCLLPSILGFMIVARLSPEIHARQVKNRPAADRTRTGTMKRRHIAVAIATLTLLICTKNIYTSSMQNYYSFHLIEKFGLTIPQAQFALFVFLASVALGTLLGGLLTDSIGTRRMISFSILGTLPFSLMLPYAGLAATILLSVAVGLILSSAFSAIVVYGQELLPDHVGLVSGLFFGLAFGFSGLAAAGLGFLADWIGLSPIMQVCGILPAVGLLSLYLPELPSQRQSPLGPA